ncbi:MAG: KTSC domain-containing protein [Syntrophothermus sp.]
MGKFINVVSSNLKAIAYNYDNHILQIEFLNGHIYEYYKVPKIVYEELLLAESKGKYAHENIYKNFTQKRIK